MYGYYTKKKQKNNNNYPNFMFSWYVNSILSEIFRQKKGILRDIGDVWTTKNRLLNQ